MKKYLIIISHPKEESLNRTIFNEVKKTLKERNEKIKTIDLYKENFDCRCFLNKEKDLNVMVKKYQEMILWSEEIILIFPVWWQSYPAVLKGFFDLVLTSRENQFTQ